MSLPDPAAADGSATGDSGALEGGSASAGAKTLTPVWSARELTFTELSGAEVRFKIDGMSYEVNLKGFPPGTVASVAGRKMTSDEERIDMSDAIARLVPANAIDSDFKLDPRVDFELRVPGYELVKAAAPARKVSSAVADTLAKAVDHPVLFPRENTLDPPGAAHSILYVGSGYGFNAEVFGPAATMRDVDWIAVQEALPARPGGTCSIKPESGNGPSTVVTLKLVDCEVLVVERKTSHVLTRRTFPATRECPTFASSSGIEEISPDEKAIVRWLRDERAK
jgi:hypothetical protein